MDSDCGCKEDEEEPKGPVLSHEYGAIEEGEPHHADRYNLDFQRNRLMLHKVADIQTTALPMPLPSTRHMPEVQSMHG